jgi:hypothetical protein
MPDQRTGSTGSNEPVNGVSNQQSTPLPVMSSEDTIYVLIDTDNNYNTGYSSLGMSIGAEQMVEIKGHFGIITKRVLKEWTGSEQSEWSWTNGNIVDAAASGSELELELVKGDYWIHIVGWNGDGDSSKSFTTINDGSRYVARGNDYAFYYRFNGDLTDSGGDSHTLTAVGGATTTATNAKITESLILDGTDDYVHSADAEDDTNFHTTDFSFESWIYIDNAPGSGKSAAIVFVGNNDNTEDDDEIQFGVNTNSGGNTFLELCYDSCSGNDRATFTSNILNLDTWYHVALTMDMDGDSGNPAHNVFIDGLRITGDANAGVNFDPSTSTGYDASSSVQLGKGDLIGTSSGSSVFFDGMIDEARWSDHARHAFAGGLMISEVIPGSNTVRLYNSGSTTMTLTGVDIMKSGETICHAFADSYTLAAGTESPALGCTIDDDDGIYLTDNDGDNDGSGDSLADRDKRNWFIDGVCWNDDGSTSDEV